MSDYASHFSNASIACSHDEHVLNLRLLGNHVEYETLDTLAIAVSRAQDDPTVRAVAIVISSDGADSDRMGSFPQRFVHRLPSGSHGSGPIVEQATLRSMLECTKPLIAYMHGRVNGIAIDLAAACDVRIAKADMTMQDTRILQGRTASTGITYLLPKLIGQSQAMRVLLLGEQLTANEARRIHFVHQVVDDASFDDYAISFSQRISNMATRAWQVHKMQVIGQQHLDYASAMVHSLGIRQTHVITDRIEGINAWRERRDPKFTGT